MKPRPSCGGRSLKPPRRRTGARCWPHSGRPSGGVDLTVRARASARGRRPDPGAGPLRRGLDRARPRAAVRGLQQRRGDRGLPRRRSTAPARNGRTSSRLATAELLNANRTEAAFHPAAKELIAGVREEALAGGPGSDVLRGAAAHWECGAVSTARARDARAKGTRRRLAPKELHQGVYYALDALRAAGELEPALATYRGALVEARRRGDLLNVGGLQGFRGWLRWTRATSGRRSRTCARASSSAPSTARRFTSCTARRSSPTTWSNGACSTTRRPCSPAPGCRSSCPRLPLHDLPRRARKAAARTAQSRRRRCPTSRRSRASPSSSSS